MHLLRQLGQVLLVLIMISTVVATPIISDSVIPITLRTIFSNRTFEATRASLESTLPTLNTSYSAYLVAGNPVGALAALEALPTLNSFIVPARDFGRLLSIYGLSRKAVQYEIGNPLTASKMARYQLGSALYAPIRVALLEDPCDHKVKFIFDRPTSTFGHFGDPNVDVVSAKLDQDLTNLLLGAAGWSTSSGSSTGNH